MLTHVDDGELVDLSVDHPFDRTNLARCLTFFSREKDENAYRYISAYEFQCFEIVESLIFLGRAKWRWKLEIRSYISFVIKK